MEAEVQAELLARSRAGDGQAFADLLGPSMGPAYRLALAMLGDAWAAEDVVQDASTSAWRRLGNLREGAPVEPWFLGIVANACRSWRRTRWFRVLMGTSEAVEVQRDPAESVGADLDLRRAVAALPAGMRAAVVMRFYLDLPVEDIAAALDVPEGTVKSRLSRGISKMRGSLSELVAEVPT